MQVVEKISSLGYNPTHHAIVDDTEELKCLQETVAFFTLHKDKPFISLLLPSTVLSSFIDYSIKRRCVLAGVVSGLTGVVM